MLSPLGISGEWQANRVNISAPWRSLGIGVDVQRVCVKQRVITGSLNYVVSPARLLKRSAEHKASFGIKRTIQSVHNTKVIPSSLFVV